LLVVFCLSIRSLVIFILESEQESNQESEQESEEDPEQWEEYASIVVYSNGMNISAA
jgi:hypothetical protein